MRYRTGLVLSCVALAASCPTCEPVAPSLRLDVPLGPGQVRCGPVTRRSELIGGSSAYGEVGRAYRCYNHKIRFIVQDGSRPPGNSSAGGSLIDVDLVRADEWAEGYDTFHELVPTVGVHETTVERIEVTDDGSGGEQGVIRVEGRPTHATLIPGAFWFGQDVPGRLITEYILRPDVSHIEIRSTVINESEDVLGPLLIADFFAPGRATSVHTPVAGFDDVPLFTRTTHLAAARGAHSSYLYACQDEQLLVPLVESDISMPICTDNLRVGAQASYSRYLFVGDGSLQSVLDQLHTLRGHAVGRVVGRVSLPDGASAVGVWVTALSDGGPEDDDAIPVNQARSDARGDYTLTLPAGHYNLVAHVEGHARSATQAVEIAAGAAVSHNLELGGQAVVRISTGFLDRVGDFADPLPAKLSVEPLGATQRPSQALGDFRRYGLAAYQVTRDGQFELALAPGDYRLTVSRGFEYSVDVREVQLVATQHYEASATLRHWLNSRGLLSAEFHQHTLGSVDAMVPFATKLLENGAEGVEIAVATDHDNVIDLQPYVDEFGLNHVVRAFPGNEVTYQGLAHFNVYPWQVDPADPHRDAGTRLWWHKTMPQLFADLRGLAGDCVIQINHPRSSGDGHFATMGLDPTTATLLPRELATIPTLPPEVYRLWAHDFEALEVNSSLGRPEQFTAQERDALATLAREDPDEVPVLADYFALLGAGMRVVATGNSDSHKLNGGVGYPRNFLRLDHDQPERLAPDDIVRTIRAQRVSTGAGCLSELWLEDRRPMGLDEAVNAAQLADLRVKVQAPPHITVRRVEVYYNGEAQLLIEQGGAVQLDPTGALRLPLEASLRVDDVVRLDAPLRGVPASDGVLVVLARGGDGLQPVADESVFCLSAPLYVDATGDGFVPWLRESQGVLPPHARDHH